MLDIPEAVIVILTAVLLFLWTRHWVLRRDDRHSEPGKPKEQIYWD